MADVFTKAKRSDVMSRIRSRGNVDTELALVRLLRENRISGWRRHVLVRATVDSSKLMVDRRKRSGPHHQPSTNDHQLSVRPDFVFSKSRTVIFVDGCFWHGCPKHGTKPKDNASFWRKKFAANKARDVRVNRALRRAGWRVLRVWEHELRKSRKQKVESGKVAGGGTFNSDKSRAGIQLSTFNIEGSRKAKLRQSCGGFSGRWN